MTMRPTRNFVAYQDLGDRPNIVVDGAGNAATVLTLSHWPKSGTPWPLKADSSAEIVFNFLDSEEFENEATAVSNNHFDEDGLVGVFSLLEPESALARRDLLVAVAHAGDFGTYRDRTAARIAFTISAFADSAGSPLEPSIFSLSYADRCARLYEELLPRFGEMIRDVEAVRQFWETEDQFLARSEQALEEGAVSLEEVEEVDLAIVRVLDPGSPLIAEGQGEAPCHYMAVNNATNCNRILTMRGDRYELAYRYESWVQYVSRRIAPRVDLEPLAKALTAKESGGATWAFDGVSEITPSLKLSGEEGSTLPEDLFLDEVVGFLRRAAPAWDPYDPR